MPCTKAIKDDKDRAEFGRYLARELLWELAQHKTVLNGFEGIQQEAVEVLAFRGYDYLRVRLAGDVYDVQLSWQKFVPPVIQKADRGTDGRATLVARPSA